MSVLIRLAERNAILTLSRLPNITAGYATAPARGDTKVIGMYTGVSAG